MFLLDSNINRRVPDMQYLILLCMVFLHIVDDYYLQGILASMKQRSWWKENYPEDLYCYDYIVALLMHGFSWTFLTMFPVMALVIYQGCVPGIVACFIMIFILNWALHCGVDHMKANLKWINLVLDQFIHLIQVGATWALFVSQIGFYLSKGL